MCPQDFVPEYEGDRAGACSTGHHSIPGWTTTRADIHILSKGRTPVNPVLDRLRQERAKHVEYIQTLLSRVDEDQRDLVDAETASLTSTRERIAQIDAQIEPLEAFEQTRAAHAETVSSITPTVRNTQTQHLGVKPREMVYPSAGHFIVDKIRSQTHYGRNGEEYQPDRDAMQRVQAALAGGNPVAQTRAEGDVAAGVHQTTADTPGLLPVTIQGGIQDDLDGMRPFLQTIGIRPMGGVPGKKFTRPYVSQHTKVAKQTAEKAELASQELKVDNVEFNKETVGGWLNISRQDIDWTSPSAWNLIISDLSAVYVEETDNISADVLETGVTQVGTQIATANVYDVSAWVKALYEAAAKVATKNSTVTATSRRLPDTIFTSMDMWEVLGAVVDIANITQPGNKAGAASPQSFLGSVLNFPRIMVPGLAAGTVIVGRKSAFEFYEERIGLLSAIVPRVFGVEVAYGGYMAAGFMDASKFCKINVQGYYTTTTTTTTGA